MALSPPHSRGAWWKACPFPWRLVEGLHVGMLGQPARDALLQDMFADAVHHRGDVNVLASAEGEQGGQLLLGLLLVHAVQVQVDLRRVAAALELFQLEFRHVFTHVTGRPVRLEMGLVLVAEKVVDPKLFAALAHFAFLLDRA